MEAVRNGETAVPGGQAQVLAKATAAAAEFLGIRSAQLGRILGISEATVSRMRNGAYRLSGKDFELAVLFVRMFRGIDAIMGSDDAASRSWLNSPNIALHAKPIDLINTVAGLVDVVGYLDTRRAVI